MERNRRRFARVCIQCGITYQALDGSKGMYCTKACYFDSRRGRTGAAHSSWRGGRRKQGKGYIGIYQPEHPRASKQGGGRGGYVPEHVLVAEKALGKFLPVRAVVHHVNGVITDNRPQNLVICEDQAYHLLIHRRARQKAAAGEQEHIYGIGC